MPVVNYHTVDGEIQGQTTAGVRTDYLTDALGSVVATVNSSATVVNTYRYKPYGERLARAGVGVDPRFGWAGSQGYGTTPQSHSRQYIRARHYAQEVGCWTTMDEFWPGERAYVYVASSPVTATDPSGLGCAPKNPRVYIDACEANCSFLCYCHYLLSWQFQLSTGYPEGKDCKNCKVWQWIKEKKSGIWREDNARGWPYPWDTKPPTPVCSGPSCTMGDNPNWHYDGPICVTVHDSAQFITCLQCDNYCKCWTWFIGGDAHNCQDPQCFPDYNGVEAAPLFGKCPRFSVP